ncbi:hypothetical protein DUNSADRAFT_15882 [Dunaliella salina]|uniref:Uncharacterized protein n=1 Tax=Dunaliella salina TaxID=3046 RepID=A0ABQ7G4P9_DUNSA|nr:hypothetical protein DUNSADRAFT_15882 [Dunaliella salina]|eukprot:KAF5829583.1 hypothetical protein DUNSADRAFT_15882 [Dunaliella salina]
MDSVYQLVPQFRKPTKLIVAGVPSLERSPIFSAVPMIPKVLVETVQAALSVAAQTHNNLLKARIAKLQSLEIPRSDIHVRYLDFDSILNSIESDASNLGISVTDQPCLQFKTFKRYSFEDLQSACEDPSEYTFLDPIHPTSSIHLELAKFIAAAIED